MRAFGACPCTLFSPDSATKGAGAGQDDFAGLRHLVRLEWQVLLAPAGWMGRMMSWFKDTRIYEHA